MRCLIHSQDVALNQPQLGCYLCCELFIRKIRQENAEAKLSSAVHLDFESMARVQKKRLEKAHALPKKN